MIAQFSTRTRERGNTKRVKNERANKLTFRIIDESLRDGL